jgi:rubrerythrin
MVRMKLPATGGEDIGDFVRWISGIDRFYRSATALLARRRALIEIRPGAVVGAHDRCNLEEEAMDSPATAGSATELLTRALTIEREAAERYAEFARFMSDHDRDELAALFTELARLEGDHARALEARLGAADLRVEAAAADRWIESGPPSPAAHEWLLRLMAPRDALAIALSAERRAQRFFAELAEQAGDDDVRRVATELAAEEAGHAATLERLLAAEPDPHVDWERAFGAQSPSP